MKDFNSVINNKYKFTIAHSSIKNKHLHAFNELEDKEYIFWGKVTNDRSYPYMAFKAFCFANKWVNENNKFSFYFYNEKNEIEKFNSLCIPAEDLADSTFEKSSMGNTHMLTTSIFDIIDFFEVKRNNYPDALRKWLKDHGQLSYIKN